MSDGNILKVFTIIEKGEGKKNYWLELGGAYRNKDGSINVILNALPINGQLQIRESRKDSKR